MSSSKMDISEKLIEGYVKGPPSFQEHAITMLAIHLCQHTELKNYITFQRENLKMIKYILKKNSWDSTIENISTNMCKGLSLHPALKNRLIVRIRSIALQLFCWHMQQVRINIFLPFADSYLTPSDWKLEMRLDEKKIADLFVQDERIPVYQRYKVACVHCLELFILSLWNKVSIDDRENLLHYEGSLLLQLWSYQLAGKIEELIPSADQFWYYLLIYGVRDGSRSTVFHCWSEVPMNFRQTALKNSGMEAVSQIYRIDKISYMYMQDVVSSSVPYLDILCFMLTQMSEEQMIEFFEKALQHPDYNILTYFLQWPYLDLLSPFIKKLWNILPEAKYLHLLLTIANKYSDECNSRHGYLDYDYGGLLIELLKETPDRFKRYVFNDNYHTDANTILKSDLLNAIISKDELKFRNIRIFEQIWNYVELEEKRSFLRSKCGESFCCFLALKGSLEFLNSILSKCLTEDEIFMFKKKILRCEYRKETCFDMLKLGNVERLHSWLMWGLLSKQDIFQFIFKIFFRDNKFDFEKVCDFDIDLDFLDDVLKRYSPSEDARKKFKSRFVKIYSRDVCIHFIKNSKWKELDQFITCGIPSEGARKRFKNWFGREYGMELLEYHLCFLNLHATERFLTWCFPSEEAAEQFRQEYFFFSGVYIQWQLLYYNAKDLNIFIKWFNLSPEAVLKFKKEVLFRSNSLSSFFSRLSGLDMHKGNIEFLDHVRKRMAVFLRWGLVDKETLMAFKDASNIYLRYFSFPNEEDRQLVHQNWDKLINGRLFELSIEHETQVRNGESLKQEAIFSL